VPAKPSWAWRLPHAIQTLEASPEEWIDRRAVEGLFGCSKTVAWRILRQAGVPPGPGGTLACRREDLLQRFKYLASSGGTIEREIARHQRIDDFLQRIRPTVLANLTIVSRDAAAQALLGSRFDRLPPGVDLSPGDLRISFRNMSDFLEKFGSVVFALNNDLEAIQQYLDNNSA
jgi:hypothetical protein